MGSAPENYVPPLLARARISDQIIDSLRERILSGEYEKGSRLPGERKLAAQYGVSTPTIREALRALTSAGLVEVRQGSGAFVRPNSDGILGGPLAALMQLERVGVEEIAGLIHILIVHAIDVAIDASIEEDLRKVREAAERTAHCTSLAEVEDSVAGFLGALGGASRQPLLHALCQFLSGIVVRLEISSFRDRNESDWIARAAETSELRIVIAAALEAGDREGAKGAFALLHEKARRETRSDPAVREAHLSDSELAPFLRQSLLNGGLRP
jgi:GntR family transcriptional repressor for pyruvate dehydrogenase complex